MFFLQLLEQGGAALPCYPSRAVLCKGPALYIMKIRVYGTISAIIFLQIYPFWQGSTSSPRGTPASLCGCMSSSGHISSGIPLKWNRGIREAPVSLSTIPGIVTISRRKASSGSQLPHSQRSPGSCFVVQDRSLVRSPTKQALLLSCPYPSTLILLLKLQGCCFFFLSSPQDPCASSLKKTLIWD